MTEMFDVEQALPAFRGLAVGGGASFLTDSRGRQHRTALTRVWRDRPLMTFIGLNPSKADAVTNDHTIRRCMSFAHREGCGSLGMLNVYTLVSTEPKVLRGDPEPLHDAARPAFAGLVGRSAYVVAAWGAAVPIPDADIVRVEAWVREAGHSSTMRCFGYTEGGHPRHPSRLPDWAPFTDYEPLT